MESDKIRRFLGHSVV